MEPPIQFCMTRAGVSIAFAALGEGPALLVPAGWISHLEWDLADPLKRAFFAPVARHHTLVLYDRPGCGLSDRNRADMGLGPDLEALEAVADHLALERFALLGPSDGGPVAIAYAAKHPARVSRLVLYGTYAAYTDPADVALREALAALIRAHYGIGSKTLADMFLPTADAALARLFIDYQRAAADAEMAAALFAFALHVDLRDQLPAIQAPTTVIHRRGDLIVRFAQGRELAAHIPGARLVPLEGEDHIPWLGDAGATARALAEALGDPSPALVADTADVAGLGGTAAAPAPRAEAAGPPPARPGPAGLRIVLFTDAEGSTALTARLGDEVAREPLRALERLTHEAVRAQGGVEVKSLGDGVMASFGSASAALRCAIALQRGVAAHNERAVHPLRVRVGINAGEPIEEGADLFGATVNAAARIVHLAEGGEVLVADVVRQLAAGKGFLFADRGAHALRGFEDPTRLWELAWRPGGAAVAAPAPEGITPREVEVLRLIAAGKSTREIADALVISIGTVERHVTNLYAKIGARGRADAAAYAFRHHLATPDAP